MPEDYDLNKSMKALGQLYPILTDAQNNIIDGFHRDNDGCKERLKRDWIDTPVKLELARLAIHSCRRTVPVGEMQQRIAFLIASGLKPEDIADKTGLSLSSIYRHMPQEAKNPVKVESRLGKTSGQLDSVVTRQETVKTHETTEPIRVPASADFPKCDRCHMPTHITKLKTITLDVCPQCYEELVHKKARP